MNDYPAGNLVDILPFEPAHAATANTAMLIILSVIIAIVLLFIVLRYRSRSAGSMRRQIHKQLLSRQLTPREAAHKLAHRIVLDPRLKPQLELLRFGKSQPTQQQLLELMQQIR